MALLDTPATGRPWYKRMTIAFGALTAGLLYLESSGSIPSGVSDQLNTIVNGGVDLTTHITGFLTLVGLYRQVAA